MYLASYVHMGVVDIYVCGRLMATVDAVWSDPNYLYSLPQIKNIVIEKSLCTHSTGTGGGVDAATVSVVHRIQYSAGTDNSLPGSDATIALLQKKPRFKQMFKITSVTMCELQ